MVVVAVVLVLVLPSSSPPAGYDISFPQCSGSYPSNQLFGIVGVNGGLANNANPCLGDELSWAHDASGLKGPNQPKQPLLSLYIDTGNPGGHHVSDWPRAGKTPTYGSCNGLLTNACSYIYGGQRSSYSYGLVVAVDPTAAKTAPWWLDVELESSWAGTYPLNIAALQGFIAGLKAAGANGPIGIYSTSAQWTELTGLTPQKTSATFKAQLPDWIAGTTTTLPEARRNCESGGFTGVAPQLAQYQLGKYDGDLRCGASS